MLETTSWPKVAVIVLNWNGLSDTCECLEALQCVTYPNFQTIVVDSGPGDDEIQVLRDKFGDSALIIESDRDLGPAGGHNAGMRSSLDQGVDYVLLLSGNTVVQPEFLSSLVRAAEELPQGAAYCPKICHYDRPRVIQSTGGRVSVWEGRAWQVGRDSPDDGGVDDVQERDYVDAACMLIRRSALDRVGLLDEDYFTYWEETDWCDRAREAGLKSYYVPGAHIWHKETSSLNDAGRRFLFRRNAFLFLRKRRRPYHLLAAVLFHVFLLAPFYMVRHPWALNRLGTEARALLWHLTGPVRRRHEPAAALGDLPEQRSGRPEA